MENKKLSMEELGRPNPDEYSKVIKIPLVIILDNIRSLNNIGSVFRTADAFKVSEIHLCGITARPPHRDIQKTALGATETVKWEYHEETSTAVEKLRDKHYKIIAIEQTQSSTMLSDFKLNTEDKIALILGHEVNGVDQEIINSCDLCVEIPQEGTKHSLNISVAAGIVIWEMYRQFQA